jgi:hypothetical protein
MKEEPPKPSAADLGKALQEIGKGLTWLGVAVFCGYLLWISLHVLAALK